MTTQKFDAIVIGLGAWGSAALQHLASRRLTVLGIDAFHPPHVHGSTHGHSRLFNTKPASSSRNLEHAVRSYELWEQLERSSGRHLIDRIGWLFVGLPTSQRMAPSVIGTPADVLTAAEIRRRFPALRVEPGEVGILDAEAAVLDPEACVMAALEMAERNGAATRYGDAARGWNSDARRVEVTTSHERFEADRLVLALGAWTPRLSKMDLPLWAERQVMVWFNNPGMGLPGFSFPAAPPATSLYGMPETNGRVKVAFHHGGDSTDPDAVRPAAAADIGAVCDFLSERVPALTEVVAAASCLYPNSPDYHYLVGTHPVHPRVVVLAGGSGHGFHQAQAMGEAAADLVGGVSRPDLDHLSVARFGLR